MRQQAHYYPLFGEQVTLIELAMRAGMSVSSVRDRLKAGRTPAEIVNTGIVLDWDRTASDKWSAPISEHPEANRAIAHAADVGGYTLEEVATEMGITRQRAGQIEISAMRKLRQAFPNVAEHLEAIREREERKLA